MLLFSYAIFVRFWSHTPQSEKSKFHQNVCVRFPYSMMKLQVILFVIKHFPKINVFKKVQLLLMSESFFSGYQILRFHVSISPVEKLYGNFCAHFRKWSPARSVFLIRYCTYINFMKTFFGQNLLRLNIFSIITQCFFDDSGTAAAGNSFSAKVFNSFQPLTVFAQKLQDL